MTAPLSGIKVLEVANMIAAPSAAAMMADLGAEVVKVEPPTGDIIRGAALGRVEPDPWFNLDNRGKQGIAIDLKEDDGIDVVHRLAASADVFVTNLTIERQRRFRLSAQDIHAVAPTAVHASLSGYGASGPEAHKLAYDMTAFFARGGIQHMVSEPGSAPSAFRPGQGDHTSALSLLSSILAALRLRDQTGEGQAVEVSLYQVAAWTIASDLSSALVDGSEPVRTPRADWSTPLTARFECSDGKWVAFCMPGPKDFFPAFAECLGHPEWCDDERFNSVSARANHATEMIAACDAALATADRATWAERFDAAGLTWGPVHDLDDIQHDPQAHELGVFETIDDHEAGPFQTVSAPFSIKGADVAVRGRGPDLGEHSRSVLAAAGWAAEEIDDLVRRGVIADQPGNPQPRRPPPGS